MTTRSAQLIRRDSALLEMSSDAERRLPPILHGKSTPEVVREVEGFYSSVAEVFEKWVTRKKNKKTQATYRNHVLQFVRWSEIRWPENAHELLTVTVDDIQAHRDALVAVNTPPKTLHGRLSTLSRFYEHLVRTAARGKLPINVFNPAHPDFVDREGDDPHDPTRALSLEQLHELLSLPSGSGVVAHRDRAILTVAAAMGLRVSSLVRLEAHDVFEHPSEGPMIRYWKKGDKIEEDGIHSKAFVAVRQYKDLARVTSGPLFRPRANRNSDKLADRPMTERGMTRIVQSYLNRIPGSSELRRKATGEEVMVPLFSPHSLRATFATVLDQQGVARPRIQSALGHKKPETTDGYCRTEYGGRDSASHAMPL